MSPPVHFSTSYRKEQFGQVLSQDSALLQPLQAGVTIAHCPFGGDALTVFLHQGLLLLRGMGKKFPRRLYVVVTGRQLGIPGHLGSIERAAAEICLRKILLQFYDLKLHPPEKLPHRLLLLPALPGPPTVLNCDGLSTVIGIGEIVVRQDQLPNRAHLHAGF